MPKSYWTKIQTPNGLKYFRADEVTDELLQKIKDAAGGLFIAKYQETTPADVFAAIDLGKTVYVSLSTQGTGPFLQTSVISKDAQLSTTYARFTGIFEYDGVISEYTTECNPTGWESVTDTPIAVQSNLAPEYDSLQTYAVDDIVHRGSELYRCTTAIDTPENWTPAHWTQTTVAAELGKTFFATMFTTPYSEIKAAYDAGRSIIAVNGHEFYHMFDYNESAGYERFRFSLVHGNTFLLWTCNKTGYDGTHGWNPQPDFNSCVNQGDIAPRYSSESTYDVGDLAYSDGGMLYRCTTAISTPETWNSNHWTSTTVAQVLKRVESSSKIAVFEVTFPSGVKTYPNGDEILDAINAGKYVVIDQPNIGVWEHTEWLLEWAHRGPHDYIKFVNGSGTLIATRDNTVDEPTWQWNTEYLYDDQLDANSVNAVQNKTLYAIINDLQSRVSALEGN